ncbi:MAG: hypothetical protein HY541_07985 [Deltaproteobacteria bacterium]|nr:hypothetical protein [Deltaproteobacteria bacterium]
MTPHPFKMTIYLVVLARLGNGPAARSARGGEAVPPWGTWGARPVAELPELGAAEPLIRGADPAHRLDGHFHQLIALSGCFLTLLRN